MCLRDSSSISAGVKIFVALPEIPTNSCPLLLQAAADIRSPILKTSENLFSVFLAEAGSIGLEKCCQRLMNGASQVALAQIYILTSAVLLAMAQNGLKLLDNQNLVQTVDLSE